MSEALFNVGDRVLVRDLQAEEGVQGHVRAPVYCRGLIGKVERICGVFGQPESLAYGGDGAPKQPQPRSSSKCPNHEPFRSPFRGNQFPANPSNSDIFTLKSPSLGPM